MAQAESSDLRAYLDGVACRVDGLDLHAARLVPEGAHPAQSGLCRLQLALPTPAGALVAETACRCQVAEGRVYARFDRPGQSFVQRLGFYLAQAEPAPRHP